MMSHIAPPMEMAAQAKLMDPMRRQCCLRDRLTVWLTMDGGVKRVAAYREVVDETHSDRHSTPRKLFRYASANSVVGVEEASLA